VKKRRSGFKGFRGVGRPKREWDFGPPVEFGVVRRLGRSVFFSSLSDVGKRKVYNLMFGRACVKRVFVGRGDLGETRPVPGTGSACRMAKPQLLEAIAGIHRHVNAQQFQVL
jgi:hypothetical protein